MIIWHWSGHELNCVWLKSSIALWDLEGFFDEKDWSASPYIAAFGPESLVLEDIIALNFIGLLIYHKVELCNFRS